MGVLTGITLTLPEFLYNADLRAHCKHRTYRNTVLIGLQDYGDCPLKAAVLAANGTIVNDEGFRKHVRRLIKDFQEGPVS